MIESAIRRIRPERSEPVVETDQVFPLFGIGERFEIAFDLAPRRVDELAQRLQAHDLGNHRAFDQQASEQIGLGLHFQQTAQRLDRQVRVRLVFRSLTFRHQLEIGVVDRRRDSFQQLLVGFSNRGRHGLAPAGDGDPLGHGPIECNDPVDHRSLCCADFRARLCVQRPQLVDPRQEITRLLADLLGDLGTIGLVLGRHQPRRRGDEPARLLG